MVAPLAWGLLWTLVPNGVYAACASGSTTLTTEACSGCDDYNLCLGFSSASSCSGSGCETDGDCTYKCLSVDQNSDKLVVLVEFGTYKSEQELATGGYTKADLAGYPDETGKWPSVSNNQVTALGRISVSSTVTTFIASGGNAAVEYPKGKVSSIILSSNLISSATSVTTVALQNLGLANQIETLSAFLPSSIESLDLSNALLTEFPTKMSSLQALKELVLDNNYVTTVDSVKGIGSIVTLSMQNNNIHSFTANFTKLRNLYLGNNNLTSVPSVIYSFSSLMKLNLTGNPFVSRDFTSSQANFLNSLQTLGLSEADFSADVDCGNLRTSFIFDMAVCITDDGFLSTTAKAKDVSAASASTDLDGSDANTTNASSSSSSSTSLIVGIMCGVVVVLLAAFLFVIYQREKQKKGDVSIASDIVGYSSDYFSSTANWHQVLLQSRDRRTSSEVDMVVSRSSTSSDVSLGIMSMTNEGNKVFEAPEVVTSTVSSIPSCVSTEEAGLKPQRFVSIWNDHELLLLQLRASAIKDLNPLGSGTYATVWLVRYQNLQLLASKRLRPERRTEKHVAAFVEEIKLIANFDHPNLVRLIGAAWTIETDLQMLLEYMEGGDLRHYLSNSSTPSGWTTIKFNIAIDIIEALVYLHSFVPPLVHRDLKSNNVLLSSDMEAKLSDFGTSRFRSSDRSMTGGVGTGRWLAPEVVRGDSDYGPAVDIYNFGTLLTELDTNKIPYENVRASNSKIMSDLTILHRVATGKLHPKVRATCGQALRDLVERCLLEDPSQRPTAPAIAYELRVIQQDMAGSA